MSVDSWQAKRQSSSLSVVCIQPRILALSWLEGKRWLSILRVQIQKKQSQSIIFETNSLN